MQFHDTITRATPIKLPLMKLNAFNRTNLNYFLCISLPLMCYWTNDDVYCEGS